VRAKLRQWRVRRTLPVSRSPSTVTRQERLGQNTSLNGFLEQVDLDTLIPDLPPDLSNALHPDTPEEYLDFNTISNNQSHW
jgi:hypothetical protein